MSDRKIRAKSKVYCIRKNLHETFHMGRWGSVSQRAFALIRRVESPLILRYRDAAERWEKGRLCFIEGKGISFISNNRNLQQEKVDISRNQITASKNKWTFLRKRSCFAFFFPPFSRKSPLELTTTSRAFFAHTNVRPNGHAPAHRALNEFDFSAFTLHLPLTHCHIVDYE